MSKVPNMQCSHWLKFNRWRINCELKSCQPYVYNKNYIFPSFLEQLNHEHIRGWAGEDWRLGEHGQGKKYMYPIGGIMNAKPLYIATLTSL